MDRNRRTFPRIPLAAPGLLEFNPGQHRGDERLRGRGTQRITVVVSSVACEGMRVMRPEPIDGLRPGSRLTIRFYLDTDELALPGQVAWMVSDKGGATNVGVSLWLELATARDRQAWATWIVDQTRHQQPTAQTSGNSAVKVSASALRRARKS